MFWTNYSRLCNEIGESPTTASVSVGCSSGTSSGWKKGAVPQNRILTKLAAYFSDKLSRPITVDDLIGDSINVPTPGITDDFVTFPVIGDVAAGYEHVAHEEWSGDTIDVPRSWLKGRTREDYFALRVSGDSMYPQYQNGDVVLVLRQETMNRSGEIGVVIYDDDKGTLKRVEYVEGEGWMKLSPVNPAYPPVVIRDEQLEHCRVLGIPKYLVREIID